MSSLVVLPAPLPSTSITLGQLITDPLANTSASLKPSRVPNFKQAATQSKYQDTITHDDHGRFTSTGSLSNLTGQASDSPSNLLTLTAEQMSHTTLDRPTTIFNQLRRDSTTRAFLRKMTQQGTPVYFVTGLQTVRKPMFKRAVVDQGSTASAEATSDSPHFRLPVRRVDSADDMASTTKDPQQEEVVLAVELLKLRCRVGATNEPHAISDVDYSWSYHGLDDDDDDELEQLSIGLGKAVETAELRAMAGMMVDDGTAEESWGRSEDESDDGGIGGF